jgi:GH25 family lysozyme M1 (1,4-beta-N-acetylmuramidase)
LTALGAGLIASKFILKPVPASIATRIGVGMLAGVGAGVALDTFFGRPVRQGLGQHSAGASNGGVLEKPKSGKKDQPLPPENANKPGSEASKPNSKFDATRKPGKGEVHAIDVSRWQPKVDFAKVKKDGVEIALLKATEGVGIVDPTYAAKRSAANKVGVKVGAYHYARPSGGNDKEIAADAVREATHFLKTAGVKAGDVVPTLDLEETGGLDKRELGLWTNAFVDEVKRQSGTKPIIYVSPGFWEGRVDDRHGVAKDHPLWVAHWGTSKPAIPGAWESYAVWQYTSSGTVDGIAGRIDRNLVRNPASLVVTKEQLASAEK